MTFNIGRTPWSRFTNWLFYKMYPQIYADMEAGAKYWAEKRLLREYRMKAATIARSPVNDTEWRDKFVELEKDYRSLEQDLSKERVINYELELRVHRSTGLDSVHGIVEGCPGCFRE